MTKIKWILILLTIFLIGCEANSDTDTENPQAPAPIVVSTSVENEPLDEQSFTHDYAEFVQNIMEEDEIPGVAVAIVKGDEIIFEEGFGASNSFEFSNTIL